MQEKIPLRQAILCEGKYDAIRLDALFDTLILPTHGFQIYRDEEKRALLRRLAARRGLVIATDSDAAGFQIRSYLKSFLPPEQLWHVYIPDIAGKERRKSTASKAGKLGVEGMETQVLLDAFQRSGAMQGAGGRGQATGDAGITKTQLYLDGFSGTAGCKARYQALLQALQLPAQLSAAVFCACVEREEYLQAIENMRNTALKELE